MSLTSAVQVCLSCASVLKLLRSCIDLSWVMLLYLFLNVLCFFSIIMSLCNEMKAHLELSYYKSLFHSRKCLRY